MRNLRLIAAAAAISATVLLASPVRASLVDLGSFSGTECSGVGGFPNCYATQSGVMQGPVTDPLASPAIFKDNSDGSTQISPVFPTIDGTEFLINYLSGPNTLSFSYDAGAGDPVIHYFMVKQADSYRLFYDSAAITSGTIDLGTYFPQNPGFSHITFFDTGGPPVPEPATWAMMIIGFGGAGMVMRRSRKTAIAQLA